MIGKRKKNSPRPHINNEVAVSASLFTEGASLNPPCSVDTNSQVIEEQVVVKPPEEALVADTRAGLTPSQHVERKLISLLKSSLVPISHVQITASGISRKR